MRNVQRLDYFISTYRSGSADVASLNRRGKVYYIDITYKPPAAEIAAVKAAEKAAKRAAKDKAKVAKQAANAKAKEAAARAKADTKAAARTEKLLPPLPPLPPDWGSAVDAASGSTYYYHKVTKSVMWDRPTEATSTSPSKEQEQAGAGAGAGAGADDDARAGGEAPDSGVTPSSPAKLKRKSANEGDAAVAAADTAVSPKAAGSTKKKQRKDEKPKAAGNKYYKNKTMITQASTAAKMRQAKRTAPVKGSVMAGKPARRQSNAAGKVGKATPKKKTAVAKVSLKKSSKSKAPSKPKPKAKKKKKEEEEEYKVSKIVGHRARLGKTEYKVRWKGYGAADDTWEPLENVDGNTAYLKYFKTVVKTKTKKTKK